MRKRILSLFMALVMLFSLTTPTAWAAEGDESPVTNGTYEGGVWTPGGTGSITYEDVDDAGTDLTLSKVATPVAGQPNTFTINLQVQVQTPTVLRTSAAATVLVIDLSNSMLYCAECGNNNRHAQDCKHYSRYNNDITTTQTRLYAAKQAALQFLAGTPASGDTPAVAGYAGTDASANRYLAIVGYGTTAKTMLGWVNVAGGAGKNSYDSAVNTINALAPGFTTGWNDTDSGGTNLDAGIRLGKNLLGADAVASVSSKYAVVLTDGKPTFRMNSVQSSTTAIGGDYHSGGIFSDPYYENVGGNGSNGSSQNNSNATASATALKGTGASLYTVCFGVANDNTYSGGPTVGNFLRNSVATPAYTDDEGTSHTFAYNADNTAGLMAAFAAITEDITQGIALNTVTDPMGNNVSVTTPTADLPEGVTGDASNLTWQLQDVDGSTNAGVTTYTYTLSYTVYLDADAAGFDETAWHPANGETKLAWGDTEYDFPVPGLKGVTSRYTVTYNEGAHGALAGQDADGNVVHENIKRHSATPTAPAVTADSGYYFTGWSPAIAKTVTKDVTYVAQYAEKGTVTVTANSATLAYNGSAQSVSGYTVAGLPSGYTLNGLTAGASRTDVGSTTSSFTGTAKILDADGNDVTYQFTVSTVPGTLTITPLPVTVTITGNTATKVYNGSEQQVEGYEVEISDSLYKESDFSFSGSKVAKGTNVGTYPMGLAASQFANNNANFTVTFNVTDGSLQITPVTDKVTVTITENGGKYTYDGTVKSANGYTVSISNPLYKETDFTFSGTAAVSGTDVGNYPMDVKASDFTNKNTNFTNVEFVVVDGEVVIDPLAITVTITGNKDVQVYNGKEQSVSGYEVEISNDLYKESYFSFSGEAVAKGTAVGKYPMGLNEKQFTNNNTNFTVTFVVNDGQLEITPVDKVVVTITGNKDTKTFNGAEQSVSGYEVAISNPLYTEADFSFSGTKVAAGTNVGTYPMGLAVSQFANTNTNFTNVEFVVNDGSLKIDPLAIDVTITGNTDSKVYNGAEQSVSGYEVEISNSLYKEADFSFSGTDVAKGTNVGTYPMGLAEEQFSNTNDNFTVTFTVTDGQLEITPVKNVVVTITGNKDSLVYNGAQQSVTGYEVSISNTLYTKADFTFNGAAVAAGTDVDTYAMGLAASQFVNNNDNFEGVTFNVTDGSLEITPLAIDVTVTGNKDSLVYTGTEQKVEGYEVTISDPLYAESNITFSGEAIAKGTDVDTYPMGLKAEQFSNTSKNFTVTFEVNDGELEITPLEGIVVTITGNKDSLVYNGAEQKVEGYEVSINNTLYTEADFAFSGEAVAKGTDAGLYPMGLNEKQFSNTNKNFQDVTFVVNDGSLGIKVLPVTVTITGNKDVKVYNGAEQKVEGYKVSISDKLYTEADFTFSGEAVAKGTVADTYPMGLTKDQFSNTNENFTVTFEVTDGELKITPVDEVIVTITGNKDSLVYNGAEQSVTGYEVEISNPLYTKNDFSFSGEAVAAGTDVDKYPMGLAASQFTNNNPNFAKVTFNVTDGELEITPLAVTVTITGNKDVKVYNGSEQKVEGYKVSISDKLYTEADIAFSGEAVAKGTAVGKYPMGLTKDQFSNKNGNFTVTFTVTDGQLEITPVDEVVVTITGNKASKVYNGSEQKVEDYTVSISNPLYKETDFSFSGTAVAAGTNVGTYPMGLNEKQFTNTNPNFKSVKFVVSDGSLEITPLAVTVTITGNKDSKVYNGAEQKVEGYTVAISDKLYTEADFAFNGTAVAAGTTVGKYPMNLATSQFTNKNDNFTVTFVVNDGQLEITPITDKVTVTVKEHSDKVTYDSTEKTVTGYDVVSISNALYTTADFTFNGDATVKGTNVGNYPMAVKSSDFANTNKNFTNVEFVVEDGALVIDPLAVTVTITGNKDSKVYNGAEQKVEGYTVAISDKLYTEADFTFSGNAVAKGTDVDTYPMGLAKEQFTNKNANFDVTFVVTDGALTITPLTGVVVTIVGNTGTKMYNGAEQKVEGYKVTNISSTLYAESNISFSGTAVAAGTDVGTYPMGLAASQFANTSKNFEGVTFNVTDGALEITKRTVVLTSGSGSKMYNGTALKVESVAVTGDGFVAGEGADYSNFASITNVGSVDNTFTYTLKDGTKAANYDITVKEGVLTVNKHTNAKLEATGYTGVYDGQLHNGVTSQAVTGAVATDEWTYTYSVDGVTYTAEMPQYQDVGNYTVYVKASNDNYEGDALTTTVPVVITPATIVVTADSHTIATGDADPELTYQVNTPVATETPAFTGELVREAGAAKGEYPITQGTLALTDGEGFKAANYVLEFVPGTLTILQRSLDVEKTAGSDKVFAGKPLTYTIVVTNNGEVDLKDVVLVDEMLGLTETIGALAVGEIWTGEYEYVPTTEQIGQTLFNTAVVNAEGGTTDEDTSEGTTVYRPAPKTGDTTPVGLLTGAMLVSLAGVVVLLLKQRKEREGYAE
ncbi:MAG: VWA domain-containing protein [Ruminococcaceae bacterium]|nr:VWA domain-containing protein [Oscillospiraceae bacterium]